MQLVNHLFGPFELNNPCVDLKLATLRGNLVLGDKIYCLEALNPTGNDRMGLDYGGLDESFI